MQDRKEPNTPYSKLRDELYAIAGLYNLDLVNCDVFEEFLLLEAGVKEKPKLSKFGSDKETNGNGCIFALDISKEALKQFLELNEKIPQLKATDISDEVSKEVGASLRIEGHPVFMIRMNVDALREYCLPELNRYLASHIEKVWYYQRSGKHMDFPYQQLIQTHNEKLFSIEGINTYDTDCFEELLCLVIKDSFARSEQINVALHLPTALVTLVKSYLNVADHVNKEVIKDLTTTKSHYNSNADDEYSSNIFITTPPVSANLIVSYFNKMMPDSAYLDDKSQNEAHYAGMTKLVIKNQALQHPGLLSDLSDLTNQLPLKILDAYRKKSRSITMTTDECIMKLVMLTKQIPTNKEFVFLVTTLQTVTKFGWEKGLSDKDKLQTLIDHAKKELAFFEKKPVSIFSFARFFQPKLSPSLFTEINFALEELDKILNKRFVANKN